MNNLYGDNIFESTDIAIDRIFESIDNNMILFDGLLNESIINESAKDVVDKIKQAFITLKDKIIELIHKIKNFFTDKKYKHDKEKMKKFASNNINLSESVLFEAASAKQLKSRDAKLINLDAYKKIIDSITVYYNENENNRVVYISSNDFDRFNKIYDENYEKLFYNDTMYEFIRNRSGQIKIAIEGMDKANTIIKYLESNIKKAEDNIKLMESVAKTFSSASSEGYGDYSSSANEAMESVNHSKEELKSLKNNLAIGIKFLELSKTIHNNILHYIRVYDGMNA